LVLPVTAAAKSTSAIIEEHRVVTKKRKEKPSTKRKTSSGPGWFLVYEADENVKFRPFDTLEEALETVRFSSSAYKIFEAVDRQEATSKWEKFLLRTTKGQDFWDRPENPAVSRRVGGAGSKAMVTQARTIEIDRLYTNADFEHLFLGDERHLELMDGKLIEKMPIGDEHTRIARKLEAAIIIFDQKDTLGYSWRASTFDLGPGYVLEPDLAYIVAERVPTVVKGYIKVVPDLAVEVHSPSDLSSKAGRDAAAFKVRAYQSVGVRFIWTINPKKQTVEVYNQFEAAPMVVLGINDTLDGGDVIPGFKMAVADLFE